MKTTVYVRYLEEVKRRQGDSLAHLLIQKYNKGDNRPLYELLIPLNEASTFWFTNTGCTIDNNCDAVHRFLIDPDGYKIHLYAKQQSFEQPLLVLSDSEYKAIQDFIPNAKENKTLLLSNLD